MIDPSPPFSNDESHIRKGLPVPITDVSFTPNQIGWIILICCSILVAIVGGGFGLIQYVNSGDVSVVDHFNKKHDQILAETKQIKSDVKLIELKISSGILPRAEKLFEEMKREMQSLDNRLDTVERAVLP